MTTTVQQLKNKVLEGQSLTTDEIYWLVDAPDKAAIRDAAAEITKKFVKPVFESCSIVNARSGKCSENCKWCAQSAHYNTGCTTYDLVSRDECMKVARYNHERGVKRFSLVTSGRAAKGAALDKICAILKEVKDTVGIDTCASLGLLNEEELQKLWNTGARHYHCNLETAPSYFEKLCSTHTIEDKLKTIRAARKIGFAICSGGIIGMGETAHQRAELAITLREAQPASIPINVLCPIPGTPLANQEPISVDEILDTIAIFRFTHPTAELRFAGGRARLPREAQLEAMRVGMNAGVVGDLLTTVGSTISEDKKMVEEAGYEF